MNRYRVASAVVLGILYGMVALGPALGFLMGSALLSQWINIGRNEVPNGITTDPTLVSVVEDILFYFQLALNLFG